MKQINKSIVLAILVGLQSCSSKLTVAPVRSQFPGKIYNWNTESKNQPADTIKLIRIAHATTLITIGDKIILTDPWFSEKPGYHHGEPLAFPQAQLPKLSIVIISHDHYDHCDMETFKSYPDKTVPFVVPVGIGKEIIAAGFTNVYEIDPWQSVILNGIKVTACPGEHAVKENTFIIESGGRVVYFGGDSELIPGMLAIKRRFPEIDLALLSVNGLRIRPMLNKQVVMDASQAATLCSVIRPRVVVPIHYNFTGGYFQDHFILKYSSSVKDFMNAAAEKAPATKAFTLETSDILTIH
jgi:L-ascorbate metabolism protein UlaG (beta-lactamase superfamily)